MRNKVAYCALPDNRKAIPKCLLLSSAKMPSDLSYKMFSFCSGSSRFQGALLYFNILSVYGEESSGYMIVKLDHTLTTTRINEPVQGKHASRRHMPKACNITNRVFQPETCNLGKSQAKSN